MILHELLMYSFRACQVPVPLEYLAYAPSDLARERFVNMYTRIKMMMEYLHRLEVNYEADLCRETIGLGCGELVDSRTGCGDERAGGTR